MRARRVKRKPPQPPTPLPIGSRVGRYEVRHVIGTGSVGVVYRALEDDSDEEFAIKEFLPAGLTMRIGPADVVAQSAQDAEVFAAGLRSFIGEGKALAALEHSALVKIDQVWEENGTGYLAMRLIAGRNLVMTQQARGRAPREAALRALLGSLISALEVVHRAGLQHGDIAPESIIVDTGSGLPVLMDRGSARRLIQAHAEVGSPGVRQGYAPVELYPRAPDEPVAALGPWTDIYSLGAVVHFIIAGKPPAPAPSRTDDDRIASNLRQRDARYSLHFLGVLDWMLAPAPADRPQCLDELRAALDGKARALPQAYAPKSQSRLRVLLKRFQLWLWLAAAAVLLGAAAIGLRLLLKSEWLVQLLGTPT